MELLGRLLGLSAPPERIEAYDISNTGDDDIVASMAVYVNGQPLKRDYRRFKLKDMDGPDDYASMEQVLTRRFQRYLDGDEKFSDKPDRSSSTAASPTPRWRCGCWRAWACVIPCSGW